MLEKVKRSCYDVLHINHKTWWKLFVHCNFFLSVIFFFFFYKLWFPQPLFFLEVNLVRKWVQFHAWGKNETMASGAVGGSVQVYKNFSNKISRKFLFFQIYLKERVSKPVFFVDDGSQFQEHSIFAHFLLWKSVDFCPHICIPQKILEMGEFKSIRK